MRERVEDLGRIFVLIDNILENEVFEERGKLRPYKAKEAASWFAEKTEEEKGDYIHSMAYGIDLIEQKLLEMREICRGEDLLNRDDLDDGSGFGSQLFP